MSKVTTPLKIPPQIYISLKDKLMGTSYLTMPPTTFNLESCAEEYVFHYTTPLLPTNLVRSESTETLCFGK